MTTTPALQLRTYRLRDGAVDEFLALWRDHVVPARRALGFEVVGAWLDRERREFTWIASHPAPDGLEAAERRYLDSPEKAAIPRRPGELFESSSVREVVAVAPTPA
ncbi:MAG TPA: hypothetical protein VFR97_08225 [Capillimicrobium sp.]|nr:hypothetical protein [Capillimicrobium sp.]